MIDWLTNYVRAVVNHPDEVSVEMSDGVVTRVYAVSVHPDDVGLIKGRRKRLLQAINSVLCMHASSERVRHVMKIVD